MNKDKYIAMFMTTLMIAIPIGAVIILIVYVFGLMVVPENKTAYGFIQDHGSLIGAIIGAIVLATTVHITIRSQAKNTREEIEGQIKIFDRNKYNDDKFSLEISIASMQAIVFRFQNKIRYMDIKSINDRKKFVNSLQDEYWIEFNEQMILINSLIRRHSFLEQKNSLLLHQYLQYFYILFQVKESRWGRVLNIVRMINLTGHTSSKIFNIAEKNIEEYMEQKNMNFDNHTNMLLNSFLNVYQDFIIVCAAIVLDIKESKMQ